LGTEKQLAEMKRKMVSAKIYPSTLIIKPK